jgi:hypothetical protein
MSEPEEGQHEATEPITDTLIYEQVRDGFKAINDQLADLHLLVGGGHGAASQNNEINHRDLLALRYDLISLRVEIQNLVDKLSGAPQ